MSKLNQFNAASNELVGQAKKATSHSPERIFNQEGMPGNLATAQGGETLSPAGATRGSLSPRLSAIHGKLYAGYEDPLFQNNIQNEVNGLTDGLYLTPVQDRVRVGYSVYGSALNSVGEPLQSTATDQNYNIPTDVTNPNNINNVGARFFR